jgi:hypothetical protein
VSVDLGGQTIAVGTATETDTASNVVPINPQSIAVGTASETDTASAVTVRISISVGTASETDSASSVTPTYGTATIAVGTASESDTAYSVSATFPNLRTVTCTLVDRNGNALPNLTLLSWAWFDNQDPNAFGAPADQGQIETTDATALLEINLFNTTLTIGQVGSLVLRADDGTSYGAYNLEVA